MNIRLYDTVKLKDGRKGNIIEVYKAGEAFEVEFKIDNKGEYPEFETETIKVEDIIEVEKM